MKTKSITISIASILPLALCLALNRISYGQCPNEGPGDYENVIFYNFCATLGMCSATQLTPAQQFCVSAAGDYCFTKSVVGEADNYMGSCNGDGSCTLGSTFTTTHPNITVVADEGICNG